jgi:hypothetical protein
MNDSMKLLIYLIGICLIVSSGCSKHSFESLTDQTYEPKVPCKLKIIVKFEENTADKYLLIGTCEAKAPAGQSRSRNTNNALAQLEKCACENGGELIKITDHESKSSVTAGAVIFTGVTAVFNSDAPKKVNKDKIYAEIYIKIR